MDRQLISSGAAFEDRVGYSRAVRVGRRSGFRGRPRSCRTTPIRRTTPFEQARICLAIIGRALAEAGASARRRRAHPDLSDPAELTSTPSAEPTARPSPLLARRRPAIVTEFLDSRWLVEIEAEAVVGGEG